MHPRLVIGLLACGILLPTLGNAQVYRLASPPPSVHAANAAWQRSGQPIFYAGSYYYPAGATVFFDRHTMTRTGTFEGVPLYQDVTLEPYSLVYVPIGGAVMRPYERRRQGALAGTVGSRTPSSAPVQCRRVDRVPGRPLVRGWGRGAL